GPAPGGTMSRGGVSWPRAGSRGSRGSRKASAALLGSVAIFISCFSWGCLEHRTGNRTRGFQDIRCASNGLKRRKAGLAGADAGDGQKLEHENLAVADAPGIGGIPDGRGDLVDEFVVEGDLELELGQEVHRIFGAAIDFRMAL